MIAPRRKGTFLFSVDLEDVRTMIPDGLRYAERVPEMTLRYLDLLDASHKRCTFFTVGNVARAYPDLIREISARGHEVACHSSEHLPLDRQDRDSLRRDVERNVEDLARAGATELLGFRAPIFSLTSETCWAHEVLAEAGFRYSSSILPVSTPLYGWPEFGTSPRRTASGVWELPITSTQLPGFNVPFVGGIYFRLLPFALVRHLSRRCIASGAPLVGYLHPYDIDTDQERFMHPELDDNRLYNALMYVNRRRVLPRLERLFSWAPVMPYRDFVAQLEAES